MDPQKKKTIFAVCLVGFCVIFGIIQYKRAFSTLPGSPGTTGTQPATTSQTKSGSAEKAGSESAAGNATVKINPKEILAVLNTDSFVYDFTNLRDPMVPVMYARGDDSTETGTEAVAVSKSHRLDGIVWDPHEPLACIDNVTVGVGEKLDDGSVVKEILPDKVILSTDSGKFSVGFYEE